MVAMILCGQKDLGIGLTMPVYMFCFGVQTAIASAYGIYYVEDNLNKDDLLN